MNRLATILRTDVDDYLRPARRILFLGRDGNAMSTNGAQTNGREKIATRAYDKWLRRCRANRLQDWLDAEAELLQEWKLTRRVAELEDGIKADKETNLNRQLADAEARLASVVAEAKQAAQRLAGEHAVSRLLAESAQFSDAASKILRAICESLEWDVGVFWMMDRDADVLRCIELWHAATVEVSAFEQVSRERSFSSGIGLPGRVWASSSPVWIPDVTQDANFPGAAIAAEDGLHGAVAFPIHNGAESLGIMEFFSREIRQPDEQVLEMMRSIGSGISEFIERRRGEELLQKQQQERRLAREIQQGLLPKAMLAPAGLSTGGRSSPSHMVGGDYFDLFEMADGCLGIAIGDASGHGIGAALMIAGTRAYVRALALTSTDLSAVLTLTNRRLVEDLDSGQFVTLFLARLDPRTRSLVYSGAGHCPGYILNHAGQTKATLNGEGLPLGLDLAGDFPVPPEITLEPGDLLFLHTDGIVEARSSGGSELFGIERALSILREHRRETPVKILDAIFRAVSEFSQPQGQDDDVTAVVIKVEGPA
jgi:serine phosphatase RsbU (regulator of sigma subunit)